MRREKSREGIIKNGLFGFVAIGSVMELCFSETQKAAFFADNSRPIASEGLDTKV